MNDGKRSCLIGVARMLNERKDKENNCNGCQELRVLNDDGYCK
ncbi:5294_t:CDS:2, partial [Racocetra persica]